MEIKQKESDDYKNNFFKQERQKERKKERKKERFYFKQFSLE